MGVFRRVLLVFLLISTLLALSAPARADCVNPAAKEGVQVYNGDYHVMQFCDGTTWWGMKGGGGGMASTTGCTDGDEIFFDSSSGGVRCADKTPDALTFADQTDVGTSTLVESDIVQITGIETTVSVSISGDGSPEFRTCGDSSCDTEIQTWGSADQTINNGDYLQLRLTGSASTTTTNTASVTIGNGSNQWDVTTGQCAPTIAQASCVAHRDLGCTATEIYQIDPDGAGGGAPFDAVCDMTTDGGGWMMMATTVPGQFSKTSAFWSGTAGTNIAFTWSGLNLNTADLEKVIANVPLSEMRTPFWTATFPTTSTFAQKKSSSEGWSTSTDTTLQWMYSDSGTYTAHQCLLCTHAVHGSGDNIVSGLATYATSSLSCASASGGACSWATSDCGLWFPVASNGHRGNGNQTCENAAWIR